MASLITVTLGLMICNLAHAGSPFLDLSKAPVASDAYIPNTYIVEYADEALLKKRSDDGTPAEGFFNTLSDSSIDVTPNLNFSSPIFSGSSFVSSDPVDLEKLEKLDVVQKVWAVTKVPKPVAEVRAVGSMAANGATRWTSHLKTGVKDLHALGITGKGILVAVVDSGIDYMHPDLGGGIGPDKKVIGGWDFVGDEWDGTNEFKADSDPMDTNGHGTHVAGIIAATGTSIVQGVAPDAKLLAYKTFSALYDYTRDDILIEAFLKAYEAGADVISASIAAANGWPEGAWATVASRLAEQGCFVSIAAGNNGVYGPQYPSDGASGDLVAGVGSIENDLELITADLTLTITLPSKSRVKIAYYDAFPWEAGKFNMWAPPKPISLSGCKLPEDTPDLTDYLVLFEYRWKKGCGFLDQMALLADHNATLSLWWQDYSFPADEQGTIGDIYGIKTALISPDDGFYLLDFLNSSSNMTAVFPNPIGDAEGKPNPVNGGKMSYFSSWGLTNRLDIKPDISAPGGNILSTYPRDMGDYAVLSGTSMAAPYISGIAALFAQKLGGGGSLRRDPFQTGTFLNRLINSGNGLPLAIPVMDGTINYTDTSILAPISQQGGGYVNATNAVLTPITLLPAKLELNDTANFKSTFDILVSNSANQPITFSVSHNPAVTIYLRDAGQDAFHMPLFPDVEKASSKLATVSFSTSKFTVSSGGSSHLQVTFEPPSDVEAKRIPAFSGKVVLHGSNGDKLEIPYSGVASDLRKYNPIRAKWPTFAFSSGSQKAVSSKAPLKLAYRLNLPTAQIRFDVVKQSYNSSAFTYPFSPGKGGFVGSVKGTTLWPRRWLPRDLAWDITEPSSETWTGEMEEGVNLTNGEKYKVLVRALAWNGDPKRSEDWYESYSEEFVYRKE
ncbi:subtilisin-like protein [Ascobolus immersus RN42]|uniref:Subtilisin-like protein n=1 Tax=Ascobolus immersus RN42 TaxID=1160509 RepID=A0A3N4IQP9_ASCIM|nr:subtilisin-like protein [Ascobolus immersus RN42]